MKTFTELREFLERNRAKRRRMRDRPNEAVLEQIAILLRIYDDEIQRRRARAERTSQPPGSSGE